MNKEEIILKVLNEDTSSWIHLMEHDRERIAQTLAKILDSIEVADKEQKRKEASDETLAKLDILTELGALHDELRKIPFYKFSERSALKWKIRELDAQRVYGRFHVKKDAPASVSSV